MAVKKHELVPHNQKQLDLAALVDYVQLIMEKPVYMPAPHVLIKNCQNVVKCLSRVTGTEQELRKFLQSIEEFLLYATNNVDCDSRNEIVTAVIDKFYSYISDPQSDVCPATSVVLVVIDESDPDAGLSAARWLVHQRENGPAGAGLRSALSCLYRWLAEWHSTPALGNWIICFIKVLEENELYDILIEVSIDNIANLFTAMNSPVPRRQDVADVILHVLASLRESAETFDRISPFVGEVLFGLAADSGQWSRQLLQNLVDILTAMMNYNMETLKGVALFIFRDKYAHVIDCLERHMASGECALLQLQPWKTRKVEQQPSSMPPKTPDRKVGLLNLGNTCYVNSVMQALLVARQFSNHVMLNMNGVPYWSRMGVLFAKMTHSITTKLNPDEFFSVAKPTFFTWNAQHDSSEFLGYLFELLQSYEHASDVNFDYSRPAVLTANRRFIHPHAQPSSHYSEEHQETSRARRSTSPRPGSSSSAGSSSSLKRGSSDPDGYSGPYKRRYRNGNENFPRRDSFIDSMFGGILLTRIECVQCRSSSLSRDVYRDLQLAFPEKPVGWQYSVQGLLEYYCSKESLTGDNRYKCRDCNGLRDAEKSVIIETTPKYLILVLKNFKFDAKLQVQTKLMHSVLYNTTVSLPTVRLQPDHKNSYVLFAAVIHQGTTLDSGHYYTLAKDHDQWYRYNDAVVTVADEMELTKLNRASTPYILFYRRTDVEEGSAPPLESLPAKVQETVLSHNKEYVESVRQLCIARP